MSKQNKFKQKLVQQLPYHLIRKSCAKKEQCFTQTIKKINHVLDCSRLGDDNPEIAGLMSDNVVGLMIGGLLATMYKKWLVLVPTCTPTDLPTCVPKP